MSLKDPYKFVPEKYEKVLGTWHHPGGAILIVESKDLAASRYGGYLDNSWAFSSSLPLREYDHYEFRPLVFCRPRDSISFISQPEFVPYDIISR